MTPPNDPDDILTGQLQQLLDGTNEQPPHVLIRDAIESIRALRLTSARVMQAYRRSLEATLEALQPLIDFEDDEPEHVNADLHQRLLGVRDTCKNVKLALASGVLLS
jgi:hypothetical protein